MHQQRRIFKDIGQHIRLFQISFGAIGECRSSKRTYNPLYKMLFIGSLRPLHEMQFRFLQICFMHPQDSIERRLQILNHPTFRAVVQYLKGVPKGTTFTSDTWQWMKGIIVQNAASPGIPVRHNPPRSEQTEQLKQTKQRFAYPLRITSVLCVTISLSNFTFGTAVRHSIRPMAGKILPRNESCVCLYLDSSLERNTSVRLATKSVTH